MTIPTDGKITQTFDTPVDYILGRTKHEAVDIVTDGSQPIYAIARCYVTKVVDIYDYEPNKGFGNQVFVQYLNGDQDRFCHLSRESAQKVHVDQKFEAGELMAYTGQTGYRVPMTIFHTHWERYRNDVRIDPLDENNQPPQAEENKPTKRYMNITANAQMIWTKINDVTEFWVIFKRQDGVEVKRPVKQHQTLCAEVFANNDHYCRWQTQDQLNLLAGYPEGQEYDIVEQFKNHPELFEKQ